MERFRLVYLCFRRLYISSWDTRAAACEPACRERWLRSHVQSAGAPAFRLSPSPSPRVGAHPPRPGSAGAPRRSTARQDHAAGELRPQPRPRTRWLAPPFPALCASRSSPGAATKKEVAHLLQPLVLLEQGVAGRPRTAVSVQVRVAQAAKLRVRHTVRSSSGTSQECDLSCFSLAVFRS